MALNAEISIPTLEIVGYPRDEESESKRRDDEAGKFDDKPDNRIHCPMTRDSSQRENLSLAEVLQFLRQDFTMLIIYYVNRPSSVRSLSHSQII